MIGEVSTSDDSRCEPYISSQGMDSVLNYPVSQTHAMLIIRLYFRMTEQKCPPSNHCFLECERSGDLSSEKSYTYYFTHGPARAPPPRTTTPSSRSSRLAAPCKASATISPRSGAPTRPTPSASWATSLRATMCRALSRYSLTRRYVWSGESSEWSE